MSKRNAKKARRPKSSNSQTRRNSNNPRSANDIVKGYYYQLLLTLDSWMSLSDNGMLFVEEAEDFDILAGDNYSAFQAKALTKNITLNSKCVQDAVNNYWLLKNRCPDKNVHLTVLTTAHAGVEKDTPFGKGRCGIQLWNEQHLDDTQRQELTQYLRDRQWLREDLQRYLASSSVEEIWDSLVKPITIAVAMDKPEYLKVLIEKKLILHGDKRCIWPSECKAALPELLLHCFEVASRKERRFLDRAEFLARFEELTTERISASQLRVLRAQASSNIGVFPPSAGRQSGGLSTMNPSEEWTGPPLLQDILLRSHVIASVKDTITKTGLAVLLGSSGMGKTTAAVQASMQEGIGQDWCWFRHSRKGTEGLAPRLNIFLRSVLDRSAATNVVLDDFTADSLTDRQVEDTFGALICHTLRRGKCVVITTQKAIPSRFARAIGIRESSLIQIPKFDDKEILEMARKLGCPQEILTDKYAEILYLQTSGHPQLVHARLARLRQDNWPALSIADVLKTPEEIKTEKADVRNLVLGQLPREHRHFLYRLTVFSHPFRREHALSMASLKPALEIPGDIFDSIVGPWVESVGYEHYRISPLLSCSLDEVFDSETISGLHSRAAEAILACRTLSTLDGANALLHGWIGKNDMALFRIGMAIATAPDNIWESLASHLSWVLALGLTSREMAYPQNPGVNFIIRDIQFRLCAECSADLGATIAEKWEREIEERGHPDLRMTERSLYVGHLLTYHKVPLPGQKIVKLLEEFASFEETPTTLSIGGRKFEMPAEVRDVFGEATDAVSLLSSFAMLRVTSMRWLIDFFDQLNLTSKENRRKILHPYLLYFSRARMLFDATWVAESKKDEPDWEACISGLSYCATLAKSWGETLLSCEAIRAACLVIDEYLNDGNRALAVLDDAIATNGAVISLLEQKAATLGRLNHDKEALDIWCTILPQCKPTPAERDISPAYNARKAAMSAAKLNRWQESAEFFDGAASRLGELELELMQCGFAADAALAWWKAGMPGRAIDRYISCLQLLETPTKQSDNFDCFALTKMLGHTLVWLYHASRGERAGDLCEPLAGMCSNPNKAAEIKDLPPSPLDVTWAHLAGLGVKSGYSNELFLRIRDRIRVSTLSTARMVIEIINVDVAFDTMHFLTLPQEAAFLWRAIELAKADSTAGIPIWEATPESVRNTIGKAALTDDLKGLLVAAIAVTMAQGKDPSALIKSWNDLTEEYSEAEVVRSWLDSAQQYLGMNEYDSVATLKSDSQAWEWKTLCATRLMHSPISPSILCRVHTELFTSFSRSICRRAIFRHLIDLVEQQWRNASAQPALLLSPRTTVPDIADACNATCSATEKYARLLLAARNAVAIRFTPDLELQIRTQAFPNRADKIA